MVRKSLLESVYSVAVSIFKLSWILLNLNTTALSASIEQRYAAQSPAARVRFAQIRNPRKTLWSHALHVPKSSPLSEFLLCVRMWFTRSMLKSKSFFLSQMKAQVENKTVCQYQSTSSSLHRLAFVFVSNYKMWIYVYVQVHRCVSHIETSLEEQKSSERASTKRWIAQAPEVLVSAFMLHFGFIPDYRSCWKEIPAKITADN